MLKVLLIFIIGIMLFKTNAQDKTEITVKELYSKIKTDSSIIILDVRTPQELSGHLGKIDNVINIPLQEIESRISELEKHRDKEIAVICRSGNRSHYATQFLNKNGYRAKNVLGGMIEYQKIKEN